MSAEVNSRVVHAVCSHDCPDSCAVLITVNEQGRATRVQGDPTHPVTRGFLCGKVAKYLDRVYSPDRLLYPMRRKPGVRKTSLAQGREHEAFERISWDEALDMIAEKFHAIVREHGSESILPYSYAGTIAQLGYGSMDRRFFARLGASRLDRTICSTAGEAAMASVYGRKLGMAPQDFAHSKLIIAWAANIHGNNVHLWPFIEEARRGGGRLIVIDPYQTRTAKLADWHIAIRPGTDAALALGMMHVIVEEGLHDGEYIAAHTHGFDQLAERIREYTPQRVAEITGIRADDVMALARRYATTSPAAIRVNYGIQRSENGGAGARAVCMLPALTGAWKHLGGGLQFSLSGAFSFNSEKLEMPELASASLLGRPGRLINMVQLGHALTSLGTSSGGNGDGPRVHGLLVYNSNPGAVAPNQNAVLAGLQRDDLFTVVHEQFFTDTADYADVLLPATTFFEHNDVQGAYGHYFVQASNQAIAPLGEARSNVWMFGQLAQRMGFTEPCFRDDEDALISQALESDSPWQSGITREQLQQAGRIELRFERDREGAFLPFTEGAPDGQPLTPSGKIEFYSETLAAEGKDPLPGYVPARESRHAEAARGFPLEMVARKGDNFMNSTFVNLPGHRQMEAKHIGVLDIHAKDAAARTIENGDRVDVFNSRGRVPMVANVVSTLPTGVVAAQLGWNKLATDGTGVNVLTSEALTDIGGGATFYSTLVEVRKLSNEPEPRN